MMKFKAKDGAIWDTDFSNVPIDEPYIVLLSEEILGSKVHVATKRKTANGFLITIGGYFSFDMPTPIMWRHTPTIPSPEDLVEESS